MANLEASLENPVPEVGKTPPEDPKATPETTLEEVIGGQEEPDADKTVDAE